MGKVRSLCLNLKNSVSNVCYKVSIEVEKLNRKILNCTYSKILNLCSLPNLST